MFLPADQRTHRSDSVTRDSSNSTSGEEEDSEIGSESDFGDDPDEGDVIGRSVALPPAFNITEPVEVETSIPRSALLPSHGPYVIQLELPRDYVQAGVDIQTRVRVNVSISISPPSTPS